MHAKYKGFSLIELLVVIAITALLLAVALPNYLGARERARDAKKKQDMMQFKQALQLYFNDYKKYPETNSNGVTFFACGTDGISQCNVCTTSDFAAGGIDGCQTVYMKKLPDFGVTPKQFTTLKYKHSTSGEDFCMYHEFENLSDPDISTTQSRCASACSGTTLNTNHYVVCAD